MSRASKNEAYHEDAARASQPTRWKRIDRETKRRLRETSRVDGERG